MFLEISQNSQEKTCARVFFNKVDGLMSATLLKKRLWYRYFPVNFVKFLRTPFSWNTLGGYFWLVTKCSVFGAFLFVHTLHAYLWLSVQIFNPSFINFSMSYLLVNPFVLNAPFLYPPKTENLTVFWCFQGVEKGCTGNKWVNNAFKVHILYWLVLQLCFCFHYCCKCVVLYSCTSALILQIVIISFYLNWCTFLRRVKSCWSCGLAKK